MFVVYYTPDPIALLIVTIAGGLLALDRVTVRAMISAPLVTATLIAALLGNPWLGVLTGVLFQLFWLKEPEAPGKLTPDAGFGAAIASAVSASLVGHLSSGERLLSFWPYGIIFGVVVAPLAGYSRWLVVQYLSGRLSQFDTAVQNGNTGAIRGYVVYGVLSHGLMGALVTGLCYFAGYSIWHVFESIWFEANPVMLTIVPLFAGVAIASAARVFLQRDTVFAFAIGAAAMTSVELIRRFIAI